MQKYKIVLIGIFTTFTIMSAWAQGISEPVVSERFMVSTANPYATEAGYDVLRAGGSAVDAAVAVQMVLNVVEPQSSGIGGGAFLLYWDAEKKQLFTYDGRETAPSAVDEGLFYADRKVLSWRYASVGGKPVGVPGLLKMLELAHKEHGTQLWANLFLRAHSLATNGFIVSERLANLVQGKANPALGMYAETWKHFFPGGQPLEIGAVLYSPDLADSFSRIARLGSSVFYRGSIAQQIVNTVQNGSSNPGLLSLKDFEAYEAKKRKPVCSFYRGYKVCGMGPPTSGGVTVLQILGMLNYFDFEEYSSWSVELTHLFTQAARLAYADRAVYLADADFVSVPVQELLDPEYLEQRAGLINLQQDMGKAKHGLLPGFGHLLPAESLEQPSTTHFSIIDENGNAVSMTSSIENAFGSTMMTAGFLLNNQLTDFSFKPENAQGLVANRVEAGKRPRSSMSPTMIFKPNGELFMLIGSPGGSRIINYVAQTIISVIDLDLNIQAAINIPHLTNRNGSTDLETGTEAVLWQADLESKGHKVNIRALNSGLHGIIIGADGRLHGGADQRREGTVMGE